MKKRSIRLGEYFYKKTLPLVIAILLGVAALLTFAIKEDWSNYKYVEESFIQLEEIAKNVEIDKSLLLSLGDNLTSYEVNTNSNGNITVTLTGPQKITSVITAKYDENLNLLSVKRDNNSAFLPIIVVLFCMIVVSVLVCFYSMLILEVIASSIFFILKKIKDKKIKKKYADGETTETDFEF